MIASQQLNTIENFYPNVGDYWIEIHNTLVMISLCTNVL